MKTRRERTFGKVLAGTIFLIALPVAVQGQNPEGAVYGPGDTVLAIDTDVTVNSNYPNFEGPASVTDQDSSTKYLNFGQEGTGCIVTPAFGSSIILGLQLTTANDAEERDPASYDLYGTNDPITSQDNSFGDQENWTLISSGALALPPERMTLGPIVDFINTDAYTSYKLIFPTVKNPLGANSMQVADAQFFTGPGGTGSAVLGPVDAVLAVSDPTTTSSYPVGEGPRNVADQNSATKYLNFVKENTGCIVLPSFGPSIIQSMTLTTANDFPNRDPASFVCYGTNDPITSGDNSAGDQENWILIASGDLTLSDDRFTTSDPIDFVNSTSYLYYKIIFPTVKDPATANSMQIADVQFYTGAAGTGSAVLAAGDAALAVADPTSQSGYNGGEGPENVIDGTLAKYLNLGGENSGFIIARANGIPVQVTEFTITTGNDEPDRDPTSFEMYGTNDPVTSEDNSAGDQENWTLVDMGTIDLPVERDTVGPTIAVNNTESYTAYRMIFPTLRGPAGLMQVAEVSFDGIIGGAVNVAPDTVTPTRGLYIAGDQTSLAASDNVDYAMQRLVSDTVSRTEFEVTGTSPTSVPISLEVTLEGAVFARSTVVQTIELWNFFTASYEEVDSRNATNMVDSTATVVVSGDLSRFVEPVNRGMQMRIRYRSLSPRQRFASNTDQVIWTVE